MTAGTLLGVAPARTYIYNATVVRVVDGDTLRLDVDLGFGVWLGNQSFRLLGCNAREVSEPGGKEARDHLIRLLPAGTVVTLRSVKVDKYGDRYDALILLKDGRDLANLLVSEGWATWWDGSGARPVPLWPIPAGGADDPLK